MKIYISGPMLGLPDLNFPAFFAMEKRLKAKGHIVLNPARNTEGLSDEEYMVIDFAMIDIADAVAVLPGHEKSKGANREISRAADKGKRIYLPEELDDIPVDIDFLRKSSKAEAINQVLDICMRLEEEQKDFHSQYGSTKYRMAAAEIERVRKIIFEEVKP